MSDPERPRADQDSESEASGENQVSGRNRRLAWTGVAVGAVVALVLLTPSPFFFDSLSADDSASCGDFRSQDLAASQEALAVSLSGTIAAGVTELQEARAELIARSAERTEAELKLAEETENRALETSALRLQEDELATVMQELEAKMDRVATPGDPGDEDAIDSLNAEIESLDTQKTRLELKIASIQATISSIEQQISSTNERIGSLNDTFVLIEGDVVSVENRLEAKAAALRALLLGERAIIEDSLEQARAESDEMQVQSLQSQLAALDSRIEPLRFHLDARGLRLKEEVEELKKIRTDLETERDDLSDDLEKLTERTEATVGGDDTGGLDAKMASTEIEIETLGAAIESVTFSISSLKEDIAQYEMVSQQNDSADFILPGSRMNLVPRSPVVRMGLGSRRDPSRVEVVLENSLPSDVTGSAADSTASSDTGASAIELPDRAIYFSEAGQLRRPDDVAIPPEQINVWTRRVGSVAVMSVCVMPEGLDPGLYVGDVHLVDPSLNPVRVQVEIAAQAEYMFVLYALLLLSPLFAMVYVWATARFHAEQNPWDGRAFNNWFSRNAVIALVVGFGAVWASLQVPFNNPTWGASLIPAAAVIGVGLIAAATVMTAVVGPVVGDHIDSNKAGMTIEEVGRIVIVALATFVVLFLLGRVAWWLLT